MTKIWLILTVFSFVLIFPKAVFAACSPPIVEDYRCTADSGCNCNIYWGPNEKLCINDNPDYSTTCPLGGGNYGHWSQHQEWVCSGGDVACGGGEPACFLAGTKVDTPSGQKNIEDLKEGDKVLSFDKTTKKVVENYVLTPVVTTKTGYYLIKTVSGREIKVTAEHPIYVGTKSSLLRRIFGYSNPVITSYSLITP